MTTWNIDLSSNFISIDAIRLELLLCFEFSLEQRLHLLFHSGSLRLNAVLDIASAEALILLDVPPENDIVGKTNRHAFNSHRILRVEASAVMTLPKTMKPLRSVESPRSTTLNRVSVSREAAFRCSQVSVTNARAGPGWRARELVRMKKPPPGRVL